MGQYKRLAFLLILSIVSISFVHARSITTEFQLGAMHKSKGTTKTIKSVDGDIIDCIDIYKQPAFNHPLLKDHIIQDNPTTSPGAYNSKKYITNFIQSWHIIGECPKGTVPIRREQRRYPPKNNFIAQATPPNKTILVDTFAKNEDAALGSKGRLYYGSHSRMSIWNPKTNIDEFSLAKTTLLSGDGYMTNAIEAGWMVDSELLGSPKNSSAFYIYWTTDGYGVSGCYNLLCPGFVQTNSKFTPNDFIKEFSGYNGRLIEVELLIYQDRITRNWWLVRQGEVIGYWPAEIFTLFRHGAEQVNWGGEIANSNTSGHHTNTEMGNGHFAFEGLGKAASIRQIGYYDSSITRRDPNNFMILVTNPNCYDLLIERKNNSDGFTIFFGGPGYSKTCQ